MRRSSPMPRNPPHPAIHERNLIMDTLLSPRRRTLLQALGAAALRLRLRQRAPAAGAAAVRIRAARRWAPRTRPRSPARRFRPPAGPRAQDAVHAALEAVDLAMSAYRPASELSRFNAHAATSPFALSPETFAVFALARAGERRDRRRLRHHRRAGGGRVGLRPGRRAARRRAAEVSALGARVGYAMLALDAAAGTVAKARPDLRADLSGIAKGYGVDRAARALDALGVERLHGRGRRRGAHPRAQRRRPAVADRDRAPRRRAATAALRRAARRASRSRRRATTGSTSSATGSAIATRSTRPRGRPIRNGLASVSVVADECGYADAMATALIVRGADEGLRWPSGCASPPTSSCARRTAATPSGRRARSPRSADAGWPERRPRWT